MPSAAQTLLADARCFACYGATVKQLFRLSLLVRILKAADPMANTEAQALLDEGACFNCFGNLTAAEIIELVLLQKIAEALEP